MITDKRPTATLLGPDHQPISPFAPQGDVAIPLTVGTCLQVDIIPQSDVITAVRLRFGTYHRVNQCHVTLILNTDISIRFNARYLLDSEFVDIALPFPYACKPGKVVTLALYSDDATTDNTVALWCHDKLPVFTNVLRLDPLCFLAHKKIRVSIVIPVFNKALYTYNCLLALKDYDHEIGKEIIIVNNASQDETAALLAQLRGSVTVINNDENQGFVQACRQGGAVAQGEFILFLNNDTQVMPGWLSSMLAVMDVDATIGITGSKLIYPDGRLQEAGGIIFSDANGCNYGRLQDPTDPRFNQSRVVDYCSGASLMIRTDLWHQLGGFDTRFAPAYYEDTDLCFAVRQAGYKVFYCHDSKVIHHEGITAGTDLNSGYKAFQVINRDKFIEKWRTVLEAQHLPSDTPFDIAAHRLS